MPASPENFTGAKSGAEIAVHPDGNFLYSSNRGPDNIAIFRIDPKKGTLTAVERVPTQGKTPRSFAIDPTGKYLFAANQASDDIVPFLIDQQTGRLAATRQVVKVNSPSCLVFLPVQ